MVWCTLIFEELSFVWIELSMKWSEVVVFGANYWDFRRRREYVIDSATSCHDAQTSNGGAWTGLESSLSNCSGCKVRGLHHCATATSLFLYIFPSFLLLGFLKRGDVLLNVEGTELTEMSSTEAEEAILEAMGRLSVSTIALVAIAWYTAH